VKKNDFFPNIRTFFPIDNESKAKSLAYRDEIDRDSHDPTRLAKIKKKVGGLEN